MPLAPGGHRSEVLLYGSAELLATMDDKVLEQITNVARLPGLVGPAMTMPDAHWGYGFPIGGQATERAGLARRVAFLRPKSVHQGMSSRTLCAQGSLHGPG